MKCEKGELQIKEKDGISCPSVKCIEKKVPARKGKEKEFGNAREPGHVGSKAGYEMENGRMKGNILGRVFYSDKFMRLNQFLEIGN